MFANKYNLKLIMEKNKLNMLPMIIDCFLLLQTHCCGLHGTQVGAQEFRERDKVQYFSPHPNGGGGHFQGRKVILCWM